MKFGAAVVAGALVMFASGYMLGYTTAVPDMLRATSLDLNELENLPTDAEIESVLQGEFEIPAGEDAAVESAGNDEQMVAEEMENLKRMVVPLLTDEEIKRIREEAAKAAQQPGAENEPPQPLPEGEGADAAP